MFVHLLGKFIQECGDCGDTGERGERRMRICHKRDNDDTRCVADTALSITH